MQRSPRRLRHALRLTCLLAVAPTLAHPAFAADPPDAALTTADGAPLLIPRPKFVQPELAAQAFRLDAKTRLIVRDDATPTDRRGAILLQAEAKTRYGLTLPIVEAQAAGANFDDAILLGEPGSPSLRGPLFRALCPAEPPAMPEGYAVVVGAQGVLVAGNDRAGTLWGAETVIQLLGRDARGPLVLPVAVHDWPTLSIRAVHLFHGQDALPFQEKLIDRVLARFKMNALFIQSEQVRWDADPTVAPSWAGSKAQLKTEIDYARARGITVYPLLESYGHLGPLLKNPAFAEDPDKPYAVDFTNPQAVAYLDKFVGEAQTLFDAPGFHVGMDEITMRGRFPYRSAPKTYADLIVGAAQHWHDLLQARGATMWMWADTALNHADVAPTWGSAPTPADAEAVRAGLPKDIVMVDWQYSDYSTYPSLERLRDAGFTKIVAATWFNPANIQSFTRAATNIGAIGAMQTTWAGYESRESVLQTTDRKQFEAMVLAADYFWNGGAGPAPADLPYKPADVFARQWGDAPAAAASVARISATPRVVAPSIATP